MIKVQSPMALDVDLTAGAILAANRSDSSFVRCLPLLHFGISRRDPLILIRFSLAAQTPCPRNATSQCCPVRMLAGVS